MPRRVVWPPAPLGKPNSRVGTTISAVRPIDLDRLASTGKRKVRSSLPVCAWTTASAFLAESHPKHVVGSWLQVYPHSVHFWATNRAGPSRIDPRNFPPSKHHHSARQFRPALLSSAIVGIYLVVYRRCFLDFGWWISNSNWNSNGINNVLPTTGCSVTEVTASIKGESLLLPRR
jgi:hypothetical protein